MIKKNGITVHLEAETLDIVGETLKFYEFKDIDLLNALTAIKYNLYKRGFENENLNHSTNEMINKNSGVLNGIIGDLYEDNEKDLLLNKYNGEFNSIGSNLELDYVDNQYIIKANFMGEKDKVYTIIGMRPCLLPDMKGLEGMLNVDELKVISELFIELREKND